jgi:diguanylate cyclase (GGDEF)-like protein
MQFQAKLLKELGLSTDSAKSWRKQVKTIVREASAVLNLKFLFSCLAGEDGKFTIEIFWVAEPASQTRDAGERLIRSAIAEDGEFGKRGEFNVVHSTADAGSPPRDISADRVKLLTKTFHMTTPPESGIVGIGLQARARRSPVEALAIDSALTAFANVISSVKALAAYTKEVERFATRDPLTNLYNQISFWDLLEYETSRSKRQQYRFSLLVIDLDNFKTINDTYGHEIGDSFLKDFSAILKNAVRAGDIPARYAGDQFTAILPVCDEGQAFIVSTRILEKLREFSLPLTNGGTVKGSVSIGVAVYPDHAKEAKDLYLLANSMLAQAKSFGKDRVSMPSEHDDVEVLKSMGEKSILILEALSQQRFVPYFQPIVNVNTMRTEAYEVLTRIVLPDRVIAAADFIEAATDMGAIGRIDFQLLEHALAKVRDSGYAGDLFINLSPKALVMTEFMPTIRKLLSDYGMDPSRLIFEITERDTVKNIKLIEAFIGELKQEGFRFAIDDFGSGYSSFQYIKMFSVDFLKVDGEFIRHMTGNGSVEKQIVSSIAALAGRLGIKTIAEYVESREILTEVESAGINYAQGYYIQKPSPDLF